MKISVVGTGYVGLVSGTCFAETGHKVTCIDIDERKIEKLRQGKLTIYEPGLQGLFERNARAGRLSFTTSLEGGIDKSKVIFLALPTPPEEDGSADLSYILNVAEKLSHLITSYTVVVDKSTVPVGTGEQVAAILNQKLDSSLFDVVSNPEFLREGVAVDDFLKPDRIVIGAETKQARDTMKDLYSPFVRQGNPIYFMDLRSAEMTKYAANAYLATRISFMNEIANLCTKVGANVDNVRLGVGSDSRIGKRFLFPGVGFGGSCFPKDIRALVKTAQDHSYEFKLLQSVLKINELQKSLPYEKLKEYYGPEIKQKKIAIWGLSFKPNTDDIREAPAIHLIQKLLSHGVKVSVFDPEGMPNAKEIFTEGNVTFASTYTRALEGADALVVMTEWSVFRNPDLDHLYDSLKDKFIFDGRNLYDPAEMRRRGFNYFSVGRP